MKYFIFLTFQLNFIGFECCFTKQMIYPVCKEQSLCKNEIGLFQRLRAFPMPSWFSPRDWEGDARREDACGVWMYMTGLRTAKDRWLPAEQPWAGGAPVSGKERARAQRPHWGAWNSYDGPAHTLPKVVGKAKGKWNTALPTSFSPRSRNMDAFLLGSQGVCSQSPAYTEYFGGTHSFGPNQRFISLLLTQCVSSWLTSHQNLFHDGIWAFLVKLLLKHGVY